MRLKAKNKLDMADLVIFVLEYARYNAHQFAFGPMNGDELMTNGLTVLGDIEPLLEEVERLFPDLERASG